MRILAVSIALVCSLAVVYGYDYEDVLYKSLLFYQAQRSGALSDMDPLVDWRKDSALDDKGNDDEDLTGGYYDAGDFVKFGFPMAFTTAVLSWGVISYEDAYNKTGQLEEARRAIKWATDYFIKCHVSSTKFYGQVGNAESDHGSWGRPEDMKMARPAYYIDEDNPGSDLAAETAAAFAAASLVFKDSDPTYSESLLSHAKEMFDFANTYRGLYSDAETIIDAACCYQSWNYEDELVWGAAWLYKASGDETYLTLAEEMYDEFYILYYSDFNWNAKHSGADVLLAELTGKTKYTNKLTTYSDSLLTYGNVTAKGLLYFGDWGSLRLATDIAFILMKVADLDTSTNADEYRALAKKQIDYALGDAGRSYVVGFGTDPPTHAIHRAASCPDAPATCDWSTYNGNQANNHILYGALVGGPNSNDEYTDARSNYNNNEVSCDINAAFQSTIAALISVGNGTKVTEKVQI